MEGVLLALQAVGGAITKRAEVLRKLGISTKDAWNTFNRVFKKSWGKKTPTQKASKAQYKRDFLEAKLRHIQQTPWPSQATGEASGDGGEEERLLTVLYFDLVLR